MIAVLRLVDGSMDYIEALSSTSIVTDLYEAQEGFIVNIFVHNFEVKN